MLKYSINVVVRFNFIGYGSLLVGLSLHHPEANPLLVTLNDVTRGVAAASEEQVDRIEHGCLSRPGGDPGNIKIPLQHGAPVTPNGDQVAAQHRSANQLALRVMHQPETTNRAKWYGTKPEVV